MSLTYISLGSISNDFAIEPLSGEELHDSLKIFKDDHSKILSKAIVELWQKICIDPQKYQKKGERGSFDKPVRDALQKKPKTFWVQVVPEDKLVKIQLYGDRINKGHYKNVKKSLTLDIDFERSDHRVRGHETVLYRTKARLTERLVKDLEKSLTAMKNYFPREEISKNPRILFVGIPEEIRRYNGKTKLRLEWEGELFPMDFWGVIINKKFHDENNGQVVDVGLGQIFEMIDDVLYTCKNLHKRGLLHGDVKSGNILVKKDQESSRLKAYLGDFDFVSEFEFTTLELEKPYAYWSLYYKARFPFVDIFGAAVSLGSAVLGKIFLEIVNYRNISVFSEFLEKGSLNTVRDKMSEEFSMILQEVLTHFKEDSSFVGESLDLIDKLEQLMGEKINFLNSKIAQHTILTIFLQRNQKIELFKKIHLDIYNMWQRERLLYIQQLLNQELDHKLSERLDSFIEEVSKCVDSKNENLINLKKFKDDDALSTKLNDIEGVLLDLMIISKELSVLCKSFYADTQAYQDIQELLYQIFEEDFKICRFFQYEAEGKKFKETYSSLRTSSKNKAEMVHILSEKFPVHANFRKNLKKIQNDWIKLKNYTKTDS